MADDKGKPQRVNPLYVSDCISNDTFQIIFQMTYLTIKFFKNPFMHLGHNNKLDLKLSFNVEMKPIRFVRI